jgi:hypothetical protein
VKTILGMLPSGSQIDAHTWIQGVQVDEGETGIDITISFGSEERFDVPLASIKQDLYTRLGARPDSVVRIKIDQPPIRRVLARVIGVPGFGWCPATPVALAHPARVGEGDKAGEGDRAGEGDKAGEGEGVGDVVIGNGLVSVAIDRASGTFALDGIPGFGKLVDDGDHGDSYNYSPPLRDTVVETPESVSVEVTERGPVRARAVISSVYRWPAYVDGQTRARTGEKTVEVATTVEVRADERIVSVVHRFVNPSRDHRLRVHLPLPEAAGHSEAECAFAVVRRGLEAEGRPDEFGLPTFPSRRFVSAGGLTVAHEGLLEYELIDLDESGSARTLALTLLRSTGMLSRLGMAYRPLPAGPLTAVAGLQLEGRAIEARYALCIGCDDPYVMADDALLPLELVHAPGGGGRPSSGSALEIEGAEVSAVRREAGLLEVRVFNPTDQTRTVRLGSRSGWLVDLRGRTQNRFDGSFELRPFGIATIRFPES